MSLIARNAIRAISKRSFSVGACLKSEDGSGLKKFDEIEAANENTYFKKLEAKQMELLKKRHDDEIKHHEKEIQRHLDAIKRHRDHQEDLSKAGRKKKDD